MYLPDHPLVLSESILSHLVAEDRQREIGHREEVSHSVSQIREDLRRLDDWPNCIDAMWARTLYLLQSGRDHEILAEYQRAVDDGRRINNYIAVLCRQYLLPKGDYSQALATCESTDAAFDRVGHSRAPTSNLTRSKVKRIGQR